MSYAIIVAEEFDDRFDMFLVGPFDHQEEAEVAADALAVGYPEAVTAVGRLTSLPELLKLVVES